ncbi:IclR family transcriptional regulator [uncultured Maritalea sp.]|uniref:IclR family transcriptional regulator n=1 Tax=uncultured Maritalea sp. TaxID=757249 RepID=UPI00262F18A5|nr:IclR family transcriptional regulator [uncultured Maritalea sp.]
MSSQSNKDGTVGKALEILDDVAAFGRPVRFNDLLAQSKHPKATLYRLMQTLTNQGMLDYNPDHQTYAPGVRLVRLAHAAWQQSSLAPIAKPAIDRLSEELGQTIHLAQLDNGQVLYVDKRDANRPIEMFSQAGKVGPGYCTGVGKAMLAFLDDEQRDKALAQQAFYAFTENTITDCEKLSQELLCIRKTGVSFDKEEHEPSIICVAVPILANSGRVLGGLSITSSTNRTTLDELKNFAPQMKAAAKEIATASENWQFPNH